MAVEKLATIFRLALGRALYQLSRQRAATFNLLFMAMPRFDVLRLRPATDSFPTIRTPEGSP